MRKDRWQTYKTVGYMNHIAVGNDPRSQGGVIHYQVRFIEGEGWQERLVQSNGRFVSTGPTKQILPHVGESAWLLAVKENGKVGV